MREDAPVEIEIPLEREKIPEQVGDLLGREEANCTDLRPHMAGHQTTRSSRDGGSRQDPQTTPPPPLPPPGYHATGTGRALRYRAPARPSHGGPLSGLETAAPAGPSDGGLRPGPHTESPFRALTRQAPIGP